MECARNLLKMSKKIVFLGMGGTIAGRSERSGDNVGYTAGQIALKDVLLTVPGFGQSLKGGEPVVEQVAQIDSKDLDFDHWLALGNRVESALASAEVQAVVITHGTDTLEETAYFLHRAVSPRYLNQKPVVLCGAMRPATSLAPDGPSNLLDAIQVAQHPGAHGVLAVFAGKVHGAEKVQKVHPYRVDAFDSGDAAPVAYVEEGRVRCVSAWPVADSYGVFAADNVLACLQGLSQWPRVEIVLSHAGADPDLLEYLLSNQAANQLGNQMGKQIVEHQINPVRGIVLAAPGNGSIHRALLEVIARVKPVSTIVRVSRSAYGQIVSSGSDAIPAYSLSPQKARIRLMLEIALLDQQRLKTS